MARVQDVIEVDYTEGLKNEVIEEERRESSAGEDAEDALVECDDDPLDTEETARRIVWLEGPTKYLLKRIKELRPMIRKSENLRNKKQMWGIICDELQKRGYRFTAIQVESKFYSLERQYNNVKINNSKFGKTRQICPYQEELDEILSDKRPVSPADVLDSEPKAAVVQKKRKLRNSNYDSDIDDSVDELQSQPKQHQQQQTKEESPAPPPSTSPDKQDDVAADHYSEVQYEGSTSKKKRSILETYIEEKKKSDEKLYRLIEESLRKKAEREERMAKMEREKINLLKSMVDILRK